MDPRRRAGAGAGDDTIMAGMGFAARLWLTRLSKPAGDRAVYRHVLAARPRRILEVGLGLLVRTERMLRAAAGAPVDYVGIDLFEGRAPADPPGVSLKTAHKRLHGLARVQLAPGGADAALARLCNHVGTFDLVLVSVDADPRHLERAWFFLQRVTTAATTVLVESRSAAGPAWSALSRRRLEELAAQAVQPGLRRAG
ncbi:MAG: hypothetical protein ACKOZU_07265 [Planctomycetaceae bacterium]